MIKGILLVLIGLACIGPYFYCLVAGPDSLLFKTYVAAIVGSVSLAKGLYKLINKNTR